jgi:hypothetical protein
MKSILPALVLLGTVVQQQNSFTGTWKFDPNRSAEERKAETGSVTPGAGMIRDRTRGTGSSTVRPSGAERVEPREGSQAGAAPVPSSISPYLKPHSQVVITQTDSTIKFVLPNGATETYRIDGRKERTEVPGADPIETTARLKGGKLTIERKFGAVGTIKETYSVGGGGKELIIELRLTGSEIGQPIDQKRVYDLVPGS